VIAVILLSVALVTPQSQAQPHSYNEVKEKIFAEPTADLPTYPFLPIGPLVRAIFNCGGKLINRVEGTLEEPTDFKDRDPKLLHPMGVVAEATWKIDQSSPLTGLLAVGTQVKAIVRLSTADGQTTYDEKKKRQFGIAIKLFPTSDDNQKVVTQNLFFLDQNGLDGGIRRRFLTPQYPGAELYFENSAPGGGLPGKIIAHVFKRYDVSPTVRPVYPLTEVDATGAKVSAPQTPRFIRLVPNLKNAKVNTAPDFRNELRRYKPGEITFDIVIPKQGATFPQDVKIGTLTLGTPIVSVVGDQELTFHHHPFRKTDPNFVP